MRNGGCEGQNCKDRRQGEVLRCRPHFQKGFRGRYVKAYYLVGVDLLCLL